MVHTGPFQASLDRPVPAQLEDLSQPHIDSFDFFLGQGLTNVIDRLPKAEVEHPLTKQRYRFWFENPRVDRPVMENGNGEHISLFPRDCREMGITYRGYFTLDLVWQAEGIQNTQKMAKGLGSIPIMVKSKKCHLRTMQQNELVSKKEEAMEFGGYFICNGIERIIRMLVQNRRHYIMALKRGAYHKRGPSFTDMATLVRCVRPDELSLTNRCHYLTDGTAVFAITLRRAGMLPHGLGVK